MVEAVSAFLLFEQDFTFTRPTVGLEFFDMNQTPRTVFSGPLQDAGIVLNQSCVGVFSNANAELADRLRPEDLKEVRFAGNARHADETKRPGA